MITLEERSKLLGNIYNSLMSNPENSLGEMGECRDEAERIVNETFGESVEDQEENNN
jgi:hypothetical protein